MSAERLLRGNVKRPFRALAILAITVVLVGATAFAQTPPSAFRRRPSLIEELKSRGSRKKKVAKNGLAAKSKLGHKKLNCEAGIKNS